MTPSLVTAAGSLALLVGALLGLPLLHRATAGIGPTWEDWRGAPHITGRWAPAAGVLAGVATFLAISGFGLPDWARAALLAFVVGLCLPFAVEGGRRMAIKS